MIIAAGFDPAALSDLKCRKAGWKFDGQLHECRRTLEDNTDLLGYLKEKF